MLRLNFLRVLTVRTCNIIQAGHRSAGNGWWEDEGEYPGEEKLFNGHDIARTEDQERKWVKKKILEKKNFPRPKEAAILTWEAMEQMRFLAKEHPETWTLDKIEESFPVSRQAAIAILKSKNVNWTAKRREKHNEIVRRNLKKLQHGEVEGDEKLMNLYNSLVGRNKMALLDNTSGVMGIPMPAKSDDVDTVNELTFEEQLGQLTSNTFTSILQKYNRLLPTTKEVGSKDQGPAGSEGQGHYEVQTRSEGRKMLMSPEMDYLRQQFAKLDNSKSQYRDTPRSQNRDTQRSQYRDTPRSQYWDTPGSQHRDSARSYNEDSPRSMFRDSPRSQQSEDGESLASLYGDTSRSQYKDSQNSQYGRDSPKSQYRNSAKSQYRDIPRSQHEDSPRSQFWDSPRSHDGEFPSSEDGESLRSLYGDTSRSQYKNSPKSQYGRDSPKSQYRNSAKSQYRDIPRSQHEDSPRSQNWDSPRSQYGGVSSSEDGESLRSLYGDTSRSQYKNSPKSQHPGSPRSQYGYSPPSQYRDIPRSQRRDSSRSQYQDFPRSNDGDFPRSEYGNSPGSKDGELPGSSYGEFPKSKYSSKFQSGDTGRSRYTDAGYLSASVPNASLIDIGSENIKNLYKDHEEKTTSQSDKSDTNLSTKGLSRRERRLLVKESPSVKSWENLAMEGTGRVQK